MKNKFQKYFCIVALIILKVNELSSQTNFLSKDPFQTHFFIENKDETYLENGEKILFTFSEESQFIKILNDGFVWETYIINQNEARSDSSLKQIKFKHAFLGSNSHCKIEYFDKSNHYFTDGNQKHISHGFKKIIFKEFYPNIDLIYELGNKKEGFKYSFRVHKGGEFEKIKFKIESIHKLKIENHLDSLNIGCEGVNFHENKLNVFDQFNHKIESNFSLINNIIQFNIPKKYKNTEILIDPWVNRVTHFLRNNIYSMSYGENIGYEVDYDSKGNVYVYGGCPVTSSNQPKLAKYSKSGNLLWTFHGKMTIPTMVWQTNLYGESLGTFAIDRENDKIYLGSPWGNVYIGSIAIRLKDNGDYDSFYINHENFTMSTKMINRCNPNTMIAFGGFNNTYVKAWYQLFELVDTHKLKPKGFTPNRLLTSKSTAPCDIIFDAVSDDSNVVFAAFSSNSLNLNFKPFVFSKLTDSLNGNHWIDSQPSHLIQPKRFKPMVIPSTANPWDNIGASMNSLAVNKNYLFFYDGHYLCVRNKSNGKLIYLDSFIGKKPAFQQGIIVDNCNNIFLGCDSGRIKIYNFTGSNYKFLKTLTVLTGTASCILDLAYDKNRNLLVFTGDSMVGTTLNPINCANSKETEFSVYPTNRCSDFAFANIKFPDTTKSYTFSWFDSTDNVLVRQKTKFKNFKDTLFNRIHNHNYLVSIRKEDGCFSQISQFWLNAYKDYDFTLNITQCKGTSFSHSNIKYVKDTIICDTFQTDIGCDSLVRYIIRFNEHSRKNQKILKCFGDTFFVGQHYYLNSGTYFDTLVNYLGCDSVIKSDLTIIRDSSHQEIKHCDGKNFNYNGHNYSISGIYIDTLKNIFSCDSLVSTKLIIDKDTLDKRFYKICRGDSIFVAKHAYSQDGIYLDTFKRQSTCDSIIQTNIFVLTDTTIKKYHSICYGDSIKVGNHFYYNSDNYTDTLIRQNGCDSIIHSYIKVNQNQDSMFTFSLCNTDSLFFNGKFFKNDTSFVLKLRNIWGCDSIIRVSIKKHQVFADFDIDTSQNPMLIFKNKSLGNTKFFWDFGDKTLDSINKDPSHTYNNDETHFVRICLSLVDSFGCADTICQSVEISKLVYWLFNSFSPGNDGYNDIFKIGHKGGTFNYNMMIYNRWGALVFETKDANIKDESKFWNGKVMNTGADCPAGSYFVLYQLYVNGQGNPPKEVHGVITLVK